MKDLFERVRDQHHQLFKIGLFVLAVVFIISIFPRQQKFKYEFQKGKPWQHEDLIAPFDYPLYKTDLEIDGEKEKIVESQAIYFHKNIALGEEMIEKFNAEFEINWASGEGTLERKERKKLKPAEYYYQRGSNFLKSIYNNGIVELHESIEGKAKDFELAVLENNKAELKSLSELYTIRTAFEKLDQEILHMTSTEKDLFKSLLLDYIAINVKYDQATNESILEQELTKISPNSGMVQKGEKVIATGELLDEKGFKMVESLRLEYESQLGESSENVWILSGQIILVVLIFFSYALFLISFREEIVASSTKITFLLLLILFFVFMAKLVNSSEVMHLYLVPFCILPLIIRTFFDVRLALFTLLVSILLVGFMAPNPYEFIIIQMIPGMIVLFGVSSLEKRAHFFFVAFLVFILYSLVYLSLELMQEASLTNIDWEFFMWFFGSAVLILFTYPLIYLFEKIFGLVSNVTLMELSDTNGKLLRKLNTKAPGTFQHSLQVANLAEEAIRLIGGNALLVRTGALYHDIGKMSMPNYFIENQNADYNPHDEISAEESATIIKEHVIHGIELARRFKLPDILIDFIRTHHGTSTIQFFWKKYREDNPEIDSDQTLFTYPGPIPYSKETAVLMMADSVEAASRSLWKYDEESIGNLIEAIIDTQMKEKQFDNADITIRDINQIKRIFKKKLMSIYHVRVAYPT